jgi:hypothetical protein
MKPGNIIFCLQRIAARGACPARLVGGAHPTVRRAYAAPLGHHARHLVRVGALVAVVFLLVLPGCGRGRPFAIWRDALTTYVSEYGDGDPAALCDLVDLRSARLAGAGRVVFGGLDLPAPLGARGGRTDLRGMLVGAAEVDGKRWYAFIVGATRVRDGQAGRVVDIRVAAFARDGAVLRWQAGDRDRDALARYLEATGDGDGVFPSAADRFALAVEEGRLRIRHATSEATWSIALPGASAGASPARSARVDKDDKTQPANPVVERTPRTSATINSVAAKTTGEDLQEMQPVEAAPADSN